MNKKSGLIVLVLGAALVVAALVDLFGMSAGFNLDVGNVASFSKWPNERIALLGVGVLLACLGGYNISKKGKK
ncbi:MAG: hypothetical protein KF754_03270 [Planctomycetes bacterium]|nr:hypothetical protein [Planctomycetota bacterium]